MDIDKLHAVKQLIQQARSMLSFNNPSQDPLTQAEGLITFAIAKTDKSFSGAPAVSGTRPQPTAAQNLLECSFKLQLAIVTCTDSDAVDRMIRAQQIIAQQLE